LTQKDIDAVVLSDITTAGILNPTLSDGMEHTIVL